MANFTELPNEPHCPFCDAVARDFGIYISVRCPNGCFSTPNLKTWRAIATAMTERKHILTYNINSLITAARKAFLVLDEYINTRDSAPLSAEMVKVYNDLGSALGAIGANPEAEMDRLGRDD